MIVIHQAAEVEHISIIALAVQTIQNRDEPAPQAWKHNIIGVSQKLQIQGICISGALFLFYAPKILKCPKIISSFLCYRCFNAKIPHRSAGFLPASFLSMQVGGDYWTRTSGLMRVNIR